MANEGATQFGSIKAVLTLDKSDYVAGLKAAGAQADELGRHDPTIRVETDGVPKAIAELKAADAAVTKFHENTGRAGGRTRALVAAIALLGPALIPVGAAATGLGAAFLGMGTVAVLAIAGIKNEMDAGTRMGLTYGESVDDLMVTFTGLSRVVAGRMLGPFQDAVRDLQARTPVLTRQVGGLASITAEAARAGVGGLVSAFITLNPLIVDGAMYVQDLTQRFERAMSGPGVVAFGDYVRSVFPQVMDDIEAIVAAAAHLVASLAPLGTGTLSMLRIFATLLSAIPTEVLTVLAQGATSVYIGFKTWQLLNGPINGLITLLGGVEGMSKRAATGIRGLQIAAGVIGVALAAFTLIVSANAESQRRAEEATNRYADALRETNGVIDDSVRQSTAKALADDGVLEAARKLGIELGLITDAALGVPGAMAQVNAIMDANEDAQIRVASSGRGAAISYGELYGEAQKVREAVGLENEALQAGIQRNKDIAAATQQASASTAAAALEAERLASIYGVSVPTYQEAAEKQSQVAAKASAATLAMQLENDAAGLLKQSLDLLNGETVSYEQALNGFQRAQLAVGQATRDTKGEIDKSRTSLKGNSDAAVTNRGNLLNLASQASATAEAFGNQKNSAEAGRKKLMELRTQIIENAVAQGMNRTEVTKFIDAILKVPKKIPPTKADIDKAEAERKIAALKAQIGSIKGKTVTITIREQLVRVSGVGSKTAMGRGFLEGNEWSGGMIRGSKIPGYAAGTIVGPGTGTSDSILAANISTGRMLAVSNGEFISTDASRRRNHAALEAGNKGAKLTVAGQGFDYAKFAAALAAHLGWLPGAVRDGARAGTAAGMDQVSRTDRRHSRMGARS